MISKEFEVVVLPQSNTKKSTRILANMYFWDMLPRLGNSPTAPNHDQDADFEPSSSNQEIAPNTHLMNITESSN